MESYVRKFREQNGLTQKDLADAVGVSRQTINAIEVEKYEPSIWLAYDLAKYFKVSIEEMFVFKKRREKQ